MAVFSCVLLRRYCGLWGLISTQIPIVQNRKNLWDEPIRLSHVEKLSSDAAKAIWLVLGSNLVNVSQRTMTKLYITKTSGTTERRSLEIFLRVFFALT